MYAGYLRLVFWLSGATREPFELGLLKKTGGHKGGEKKEKKSEGGEKVKRHQNTRRRTTRVKNKDGFKKNKQKNRCGKGENE